MRLTYKDEKGKRKEMNIDFWSFAKCYILTSLVLTVLFYLGIFIIFFFFGLFIGLTGV